MKLQAYHNLINAAVQYVVYTSKRFNIDESHSLKHSIDVFHTANKIYEAEVKNYPYLSTQKNIIDVSSLLHDMCDKKYVNQEQSIADMTDYMSPFIDKAEIDVVSQIISTMSYSTVKKNGYPVLGEYQLAYHIVREADLLTAYDSDRCIIYGMMRENLNYIDSTKRAIELSKNRVLTYISDNLFVTEYSKEQSRILHEECIKQLEVLNNISG